MPETNGTHSLANAKFRKVIDFNAFRREHRRDLHALIIPIDDAEYEFPPNMPASVMLTLMAFYEEHGANAEIPDEMGITLLGDVIGTEQVREIAKAHDLDTVELLWIFEQLMGHYFGTMSVEEQAKAVAGNAEAPQQTAPAASTSSTTGRRSKRTSSASTVSTLDTISPRTSAGVAS